MNRQLFANGIELDLTGSTVIAVTYQANNIGELQKRQGSFTNTFQVIANDHNAQALEYSHLMTSSTLLPYKKILSTYIQNGVEVFSDGEMRISKVENGYFHLNVVAGNVDLSSAIGDLIVGELFADDTVYPWTLQNVYDSRDKSRYYIYPIIDWRIDLDTMFDAPTIDVRQLLPCALMTSIFERLEDYTGYTFTGDYIESDEHKNMVLTPSDFSRNPDYYNEDLMRSYGLNNGFTGGVSNQYKTLSVPMSSSDQIDGYALSFFIDDGNFSGGVYYPPVDEVATLSVKGSFKALWEYDDLSQFGAFNSPSELEIYLVAQIKEAGTIIAEETYGTVSGSIINEGWGVTPLEIVVDLSTPEMILSSSTYYFVQFILHVKPDPYADSTIQWTLETPSDILDSGFTSYPTPSIVYGQDIRFRDLFRMSVKNVFYDILNLRGIIIQTNSYTKEVQFNFFNDLIKNKSIAKDWSDKISIKSKSLAFQFGSYAQRNDLLFKDNSEVTKGLGNYYFNVEDENLNAEATAVQLKHPATEQTNKYLGSNIPSIEGIDDLNKWHKPEYRILQMSVQNSSYTVTFDDGTTALYAVDNIPYCKFEGFDVLVPKYYEALTDILETTKALNLVFDLTPIDIQELDFSIPIFLNVPKLDLNGYFYLNSISNYKGGATACQLIRL
jgi:hypothetical protein